MNHCLNPFFVVLVGISVLLARRPVHGTSAEYVDVEVMDGLPSVITGVEDQAIAFWEFALGQSRGFFEEMAEELGGSFGGVGEVLFGDEEPVGGSLRVDIGEGEGVVVFVDSLDRDLVLGDLAEEAVWHRIPIS